MFKQAPLPFVGQKRMFLKRFEEVLNANIKNDGEGWTIIDTFGGSGLLSHVAKQLKPKACVIYNDFDGYAERLEYIDDINALRAQLYAVVGNATQKNKRLTPEITRREAVAWIDGLGGTLRREEITVATKPKKKCRTCGGFCGKRPGEKCRHGANAAKQQADELWAAVTGRKK